MKITMTFIDPEKLKRINDIQAAKEEFERLENKRPKKKIQS